MRDFDYLEPQSIIEASHMLAEHRDSCRMMAGGTALMLALRQRMVAPSHFAEAVRGRIRKRSGGRFFRPRRLAERIPYELFSLVMLGLLLAIYVVLTLAEPSRLRLP